MSDYTPTTEDIRNAYMSGDWNDNPTDDDAMKRHFAAKFDRWLAAHDAEVYQRGREDAAKAVVALCRENPYIFPNDPASIDAAIAAARGHVSCAHSRTQYTREVCWCGDAVDVCEDCGVDVHECADGADAGNRNASVPEDATPHAASTNPDSAPRGERGDGEQA